MRYCLDLHMAVHPIKSEYLSWQITKITRRNKELKTEIRNIHIIAPSGQEINRKQTGNDKEKSGRSQEIPRDKAFLPTFPTPAESRPSQPPPTVTLTTAVPKALFPVASRWRQGVGGERGGERKGLRRAKMPLVIKLSRHLNLRHSGLFALRDATRGKQWKARRQFDEILCLM